MPDFLSPPFAAPDYETALVASAMHLDPGPVVMHTEPEHFASADCRLAMQAIVRLFSEGTPVDPLTVARQLEADGRSDANRIVAMSAIGGACMESDVPHYALVVWERYVARESYRAAQRLQQHLAAGEDVPNALDGIQNTITDLVVRKAGGDTHIRAGLADALTVVDQWEAGQDVSFYPSGFYSLDGLTGGYPVGELVIYAAMSGAGKTSLLIQMMRVAAAIEYGRPPSERGPIVLFSAEMTRRQLIHRAAAQDTGLSLRDLRDQAASPEQYNRFRAAIGRYAALEIHIDDEPAPTLTHIAGRLHAIAAQHGGRLGLVGVDYDEKVDTQGESEELRVAAVSKGLKAIAKRFGAPVVALSQYSSAATADRKPSDSWLRYSRKKFHEAAQVIHWWHPGYWVERGANEHRVEGYDARRPERGFLVVSKNRFGPLGQVPLDFEAHATAFLDPEDPSHRHAYALHKPTGIWRPASRATEPAPAEDFDRSDFDRSDFDRSDFDRSDFDREAEAERRGGKGGFAPSAPPPDDYTEPREREDAPF